MALNDLRGKRSHSRKLTTAFLALQLSLGKAGESILTFGGRALRSDSGLRSLTEKPICLV